MALVSKPFADIITFTRASTATYFDATGTLQSAAIDAPRFDYDPATLAARGFLIEEARTNSILQSGWAGAVGGSPGTAPTSWNLGTVAGTPTTTLATSIYGASEQAVLFTGVTNDRLWYQQSINVTAGVTYTASVFCEVVTGTPRDVLEIVNGTATRTIITRVTNNPTSGSRATIVFSADTTGNVVIRIGIGTTFGITANGTAQLSRPQVEAGAFPTSYIPTTTTALTRSADVASVNTLSPWYRADEGTLFAEFALTLPASGSNQFLARFSDNSYNNSIADNVNSTGFAALVTAAGGVFDGNATTAVAVTANTVAKFAAAYAANDLAACKDGGAVATDSTATIPSGLTRFDLGSDHIGLNRVKAGYLRRITYYPRRLSNAELQSLTV